MKPLHVALLAALLAVGATVVYMLGADRDRHDDPRLRDDPAPLGTPDDARHRAPLERGGSLSVSLAIRMPDDSAAAGAAVELHGAGVLRAVADAAGRIAIEGLHPGIYHLLANRDAATGALDFELKAPCDLGVLRLAKSVAIRGHVFDARRHPVAGAIVEALLDDTSGHDATTFVSRLNAPGRIAVQVATNAEGAYELRVAAGQRFAVRATAAGYAQEGEAARTYTGDVEGLDFHLFGGVRLAGRVIDAEGAPIAGARVMLLDPLSTTGLRLPKVEAVSSADGSFDLTTLPREDLILIVRATGHAAFLMEKPELPQEDLEITLEPGIAVRLRTVDAARPDVPAPFVHAALILHGSVATGRTDEQGHLLLEHLPRGGPGRWDAVRQGRLWGGDFVPRRFTVEQDPPADGVFDLGAIPMTRGGTIRGRVIDRSTGAPIPGATVRAIGGRDPESTWAHRGATSGPRGDFELRGVPLEASVLTARHPLFDRGGVDPLAFFEAMHGGTSLFVGGATAIERDVELARAASVSGVVLAPDGAPVGAAEITVRDEMALVNRMLGSAPASATSDAQGRFTLTGLIAMDAVPIFARHRDHGASERVMVRVGRDDHVELRMTEPPLIEGIVVDEKGTRLAGVRVTVERDEERGTAALMTAREETIATRPSVTNERGEYVLRNAPPGKLIVRLAHPGYMPEAWPITIQPGTKRHTVEQIVLPRGAGIEGVCVDEESNPLAGVRVAANFDGQPDEFEFGRDWGTARTDAKGRFAVWGLRKGTFRLRVLADGYDAPVPKVPTGTKAARLVLKPVGLPAAQ